MTLEAVTQLPSFTLEGLLCHPDGFGLTTATPVQRAFCRCIEGIALGSLARHPDVQWAFGGADAIRALPLGAPPTEVDLVAAVRIGKTLLSSAIAFKAALTCDLTGIGLGEEPVYSIMATHLRNAKIAINHLQGRVPNRRLLRPHFLGLTQYSITIRHAATGRPIKIMAVAGNRAGAALASTWSCGLALDEFGKMMGQDEGVVNYDDCVRVILPRLRKGATIFAPGSPWAPRGPAFNAVQDSWGKPTKQRVVIRCRGPMANPALYTPAFIEGIRRSQNGELTVQTEVMAEFGDLPTQFFTGADIGLATRNDPLEMPYDPRRTYVAFMDPATRGNAWTIVIASRLDITDYESESVYEVALAFEWIGTKQEPLKAKVVFSEMQAMLERYSLDEVWSDQHNFDSNKEIAEDFGITLKLDEATKAEKDSRFLALRDLVVEDAPQDAGQLKRVSLPPLLNFRADMLAIVKELTRSGISFPLPIGLDGRHCDYAPSVTGALAKLAEGAGSWMSAMTRMVRPQVQPATSFDLRAARIHSGMTVQVLALAADVSTQRIELAENGDTFNEMFARSILLACGLTEDWRAGKV